MVLWFNVNDESVIYVKYILQLKRKHTTKLFIYWLTTATDDNKKLVNFKFVFPLRAMVLVC